MKNHFLDSLKHLHPIQKEEISVTPSLPPENSSIEGADICVAETKNTTSIYLGRGSVYLDPSEAYQALLAIPETEFPQGYRNTLTKAFFNGTETGQIQTLFRDWKRYKAHILPKISEFFAHIKANPETCPVSRKYATFVISGKDPIAKETFAEGSVDLWFFKFWVLFKFFVESRDK